MFDQLDGGPVQLHLAQHHLAGDEIGQPVGNLDPGQIDQQRSAGVSNYQIFQGKVVEE